MNLITLPDGDVVAAARDPCVTGLAQAGITQWVHRPLQVDFAGQYDRLSVSGDGKVVDFSLGRCDKLPARVELDSQMLGLAPLCAQDPMVSARL